MDNKQYLKQSERTVADIELHFDEKVFIRPQQVLHEMVGSVQAGMTADIIKRSLFYRDPKIEDRTRNNTTQLLGMYETILGNPDINIPKEKVDLLHAALGMQSEAGEVTEEVVASILQYREVDIENIKEELGDQLWYIALALRAIGSNFGEVMQQNIDKLAKRYPEKFTSEDALARADKDQTE